MTTTRTASTSSRVGTSLQKEQRVWRKFILSLAAGLLLASGAVYGATSTANFTVRVTITAECIINTPATLDFGSNGVINSNIDQTTDFKVRCTNTTPYSIGLDAGTGTGATVAARKMTNGANTVTYSLYVNSARTTVWGNTVGTNTVAAIGTGSSDGYTIYGRVPPQSTPAPGVYVDTITLTVTY